jgi:prepilin-type N-terminal cleavage/methylation domain-containing protein
MHLTAPHRTGPRRAAPRRAAPRRAAPRRAAADGGFTLIELLVTVVILGLVSMPLMNVVLGSFSNSASTRARLAESHDEQIAAGYWQQDAAGTGIRAASYDPAGSTFPLLQSVGVAFPCALPAGATAVAVLGWNRYDGTGTATRITVAWATAAAGTETRLLRLHCTGSTLDATAVLAHTLDPANPPVLSCAGSAGTSCTGAGTAVPSTLNLRLTIKDPSGRGQPYAVTLTGQRRQT